MNPLFKTLLNKAHDEAFKAHVENCAKTGRDPAMPHANALDMTFEKFAELIVRECAKVVFEKTGPKSALNVLEHFGVEE